MNSTIISRAAIQQRVLAGSIVQATPLRLEYLNRVLAAYQVNYDALRGRLEYPQFHSQ